MTAYTIGVCEEMCPKNEILVRQKNRLLHKFEIQEGSNSKLADPDKTVKEFRRSAAGVELNKSNIRSPVALKKTMVYLIKRILPRNDVEYCVVYDFIFDRIRAIRQDLVIQHYLGPECVFILEASIKFYVYSAYLLGGERISTFDPHINSTHLQECLKQLMKLYEKDKSFLRPEMISLYLLYNLESDEALIYVIGLPKALRSEVCIEKAIQFVLSWRQKNYVRLMRIMKDLTVFQMVTVHFHIQNIRRQILTILSVAYNKSPVPISVLEKILNLYSEKEVVDITTYYGFEVKDQSILLLKTNFNQEKKIYSSFKPDFMQQQLDDLKIDKLILVS